MTVSGGCRDGLMSTMLRPALWNRWWWLLATSSQNLVQLLRANL